MKDNELDQIREQSLKLRQQLQAGLINFLGDELDLIDIFYDLRKIISDLLTE